MRKVIVSLNTTLDGLMAGPNCELDWHFNYWNEEMASYAGTQLSMADTILLGRITYMAMAKYWPARAADMLYSREDIAFSEMMNNHRKIVFSRTLGVAEWNNSRIVQGDLKTEMIKLKQGSGQNMIVFGSGSIVSALTQLNMVDEYLLWMHPVVLGQGKPVFKNIDHQLSLQLVTMREFDSGVIILKYRNRKKLSHFKLSGYGNIHAQP